MLSMVFLLPAVFGFVIWRSYRSEGERARRGEATSTPGALRWTVRDLPGDQQR